MDVGFFSDLRTNFIRMYYREGRKPFDAMMVAIDNEEPPYDEPPCNFDIESGEPPYLDEWLDAQMALNVLGLSCLSMLSNSLKLVFISLEREFGFRPTEEAKTKHFKKQGFVAGYKHVLSEILDTDWSDCPADLAIIEQVVLVRNVTQHPDDHSGFDAYYDEKAIAKHPRPFFVSERDAKLEPDIASWFVRRIEVTEHELFRAIEEVEKLVAYIIGREDKAYAWRKSQG